MPGLHEGQLAIRRELVELPVQHCLRAAARQNVCDSRCAEAPVERADGLENEGGRVRHVHLRLPAFAVAAVAAGLVRLLPEVGQDEIAEAGRRLAVIDHGIQAVVVHLLLLFVLIALIDEVALDA